MIEQTRHPGACWEHGYEKLDLDETGIRYRAVAEASPPREPAPVVLGCGCPLDDER